jgi:5-methylcytosine-specific restriction endonuclease McrA
MEREIRNCKTHGMTEHALYTSGDKQHWRCLRCQVEATQRRRDKLKQKAVEYKGGCCSICGYDKCIDALEFHHINPEEKDFGIAQKGYTRSWESVKEELDKCILVCSNCHREIHSKQNKDQEN